VTRVLIWHVHGSYMTSLAQSRGVEWIVPVLPDRGPDGRGRARTWDWPASVVELSPGELRDAELDAVVLQRPRELEQLCADWTGRVPGRDLPAVYLEHNAPQGRVAEMGHPARDRDDLRIVHVTHFNDLFWDAGATPTSVIEHGIVDPGDRYTGELARAGVAINEARRRRRVTGTDLLARIERASGVGLDVFGIDAGGLGGFEDYPQERLHAELARRRAYLHPIRWTSLGLSLLEAMHLGMPVVALATTEVVEAVPREAGVVSTDVDRLAGGLRELVADPDTARAMGRAARRAALERYGLARFLTDWEALLADVTGHAPAEEEVAA
jgi:glycosyltransferase involved in cell wall biosynthesis